MPFTRPSTVRDGELRQLLRHVAATDVRAVVVRGPAGMGKSTLLVSLRDALRSEGATVQIVRPTEAEQGMPFTALVDLLAGLPQRWYDDLPPAQRSAVRTALLLEETGEEVDPRAVAAGLAGIIERSRIKGPIVAIIDDAQWLDPASRAMIAATLRRIRSSKVTVVAATRPVENAIETWLPGPVEVIELDPLRRDQLHRMLRLHLGEERSPALLRRVVAQAGGNPLFALQLARNEGHRGQLDQLIARQVYQLPYGARLVMLAAALAVDRSVETIAAALELSALEVCERLDPARQAGLVGISRSIRFEHPLYAEAVVSLAAEPERRRVREALAHAEPDADARVAHRAAVTVGADDELAAQLEEAAVNARRRGAWDRSADLMAAAVAHTSTPDVQRARMGRLGEWLVRGGRSAEGETMLQGVYAASQGKVRHDAAVALAELFVFTGRPTLAAELVADLQRSDADPEVRARSLLVNPLLLGDRRMLARAEEAERILVTLPGSREVDEARTTAVTLRARCLMGAAEPADDVLAEAVAREGTAPPYAPLQSAAMLAASHAHWGDQYAVAERGYRALVERALDVGDEESLPTLMAFAAANHARHGRWEAALDDIEAAHGGEGQHQVGAAILGAELAWIEGHTDPSDEAFTALAMTLRTPGHGWPALEMYQRSWLGEILLGREEHDEAEAVLAEGLAHRASCDIADPGPVPLDTDWAEALIARGDVDAAATHLATTVERAKRMGRDNVLAACLRIQVLLHTMEGRTDAALAAIPDLLRAYDAEDRRPLDRARAHLAVAEALRRGRMKRDALEHLQQARGILAATGHETWRLRAERAIARIGVRKAGPANLTGTELRAAQLAASGLRNREIASSLFVDVKTVEATLTRAYRKLGIRSRVELARALEGVGGLEAPAAHTTEPAVS